MNAARLIDKRILATPSKVLKKYVCDGCGHEAKEMELLMPVGPNKGNWVRTIANCTCETIKISKQVTKELEDDRRKKIFTVNSIVSEELKQARFENYKPIHETQKEALRLSQDYAANFSVQQPRNLIYRGPYGVGKSHLSYSVVREVFKKEHKCIFINVPKLLTRIRSSYKNNSKYSESDLLEAMVDAELLVLDEIGRGYDPNGWAEGKLFEIIDERSGKNTLYTTNYGANELAEAIGGHNVSRMLKNATAIVMDGKDGRRAGSL